jgi:predicted MPP superfamily phosphohydrolase
MFAISAESLQTAMLVLAAVSLVGVPVYARLARGGTYSIFVAVILLLLWSGVVATETQLAGWVGGRALPWVTGIWIAGGLAASAHLVYLVRARLRSRWFRALISVPGQTFIAAGFLAGPWQLLLWPLRTGGKALEWDGAITVIQWLDLAPFALAAASIATSVRVRAEWVRVHLATDGPERTERVPVQRHRRAPAPLDRPGLRIVQISDPHLGPWQSVKSLQRILASLLEHDPDLVLLTGDFLTMEGQGTPGALKDALAPLGSIADRCFAIFGNHDHEAPQEVRSALEGNGITLLVDQEALISTPIGMVQLVGADYVGRGSHEHLNRLLELYPRRPAHHRLLLLHDPLGFNHLESGEVDLTLSGHTHGGQLGLVSLGLDWTVLKQSRWPDHGLFGKGSNRLYVHRGTGFYGFPLRIGVPPETSLLEVVPHAH